MKIILTQEVTGLGQPGDVVEVKDGYGRNYLLPRNVAIRWTRGGEKTVESIKKARATRAVRDQDHAAEIKGKLGLRGQATAEIALDDVRVPASAMLGAEGEGFTVAMQSLDKGRVSVAAGCVGIAQAALDAAVGYAGRREQFGRTIAHHQLVQELISDIAVDVDAARLLTWRVADLVDRGEPFAVEASKAKLFATEASVRAANNCIQAYGGYGYVDEYPGGKYLRDARVTTLYEGTSQIQKLIIGRALTGINAF